MSNSLSLIKPFFQQWIALVTTPQGWKMPEKSKITFENTGVPEEIFEYSFCEVREQHHVTLPNRLWKVLTVVSKIFSRAILFYRFRPYLAQRKS